MLFDSKGAIKKYSSVHDIVDEFMQVRLAHYVTRKAYLVQQLETTIRKLQHKRAFIEHIQRHPETIGKPKSDLLRVAHAITGSDDPDANDALIKVPVYDMTLEKVQSLDTLIHDKLTQLNLLQTTDHR